MFFFLVSSHNCHNADIMIMTTKDQLLQPLALCRGRCRPLPLRLLSVYALPEQCVRRGIAVI